MNSSKILRWILCLYLLQAVSLHAAENLSTHQSNPYAETLTQISTINSLMAGNFDGTFTFGELKHYGDFGIGTFHSLDGEMIELDGKIYQARVDGKVYLTSDSAKTPFSTVTFFEPDEKFPVTGFSLEELKKFLDEKINKNFFYAVRIDGDFNYVKTRSETSQKPYPTLVEAIKKQAIFEKKDVRGTLVGIYCPEFVNGLNIPGYHFHFLSDDRSFGGHVLEANVNHATARIDKTPAFNMLLPADFSPGGSKKGDIERVEKEPTTK